MNQTAHATRETGSSSAVVFFNKNFGKDPNDLVNSEGALNIDRRWMFKFSLGYNFPLDILVSTNYVFQTGRPYPVFTRIFGLNQAPYVTILSEPKGPNRFDSLHLLNVRVEKGFNLYKTFKLRAFVDIFNLLNTATVTNYRSFNTWQSSFQETSRIPHPRTAQIGLKLEF